MRFNGLPTYPSETVQDSVIASGLITAPAWGAWLGQLNGLLTTISLIIGLLIGLHRLWLICRAAKTKKDQNQPTIKP